MVKGQEDADGLGQLGAIGLEPRRDLPPLLGAQVCLGVGSHLRGRPRPPPQVGNDGVPCDAVRYPSDKLLNLGFQRGILTFELRDLLVSPVTCHAPLKACTRCS